MGQKQNRKRQKEQQDYRQKNKRGDVEQWDQTGSPEIPDRGETEIPRPPLGGVEEEEEKDNKNNKNKKKNKKDGEEKKKKKKKTLIQTKVPCNSTQWSLFATTKSNAL